LWTHAHQADERALDSDEHWWAVVVEQAGDGNLLAA